MSFCSHWLCRKHKLQTSSQEGISFGACLHAGRARIGSDGRGQQQACTESNLYVSDR